MGNKFAMKIHHKHGSLGSRCVFLLISGKTSAFKAYGKTHHDSPSEGVSANCLQTMTQLLFPQLLHELFHLLPKPFHIPFSHPCLWLSKLLNHISSILQDGRPNTEPPTISSRHTVFTSCQREGQGLSFISILLLFILFFIFLVGIFRVDIFYHLFLFGRHCS